MTLNKKQTNEESNSAAITAETNPVMWSLVTNTIPHGLTITSMVTPATEESMMAVVHFTKIFDPGKNGVQLSDESKCHFLIRASSAEPGTSDHDADAPMTDVFEASLRGSAYPEKP